MQSQQIGKSRREVRRPRHNYNASLRPSFNGRLPLALAALLMRRISSPERTTLSPSCARYRFLRRHLWPVFSKSHDSKTTRQFQSLRKAPFPVITREMRPQRNNSTHSCSTKTPLTYGRIPALYYLSIFSDDSNDITFRERIKF